MPVLNLSNIGATMTVAGGGGNDTLSVYGNTAANVFTVNGTSVAITGLVTTTYNTFESLKVYGSDGPDTFNVTTSAIPTFVDGGDPIGLTGPSGDTLAMTAGGGAITYAPGPLSDEGGFSITGGTSPGTVSFVHIENIAPVVGPGPVTIMGTNGDDDITIIARDASYNALADGVQDFTVSVNAGPDILFINAANLTVNALSGDDEFSVTTPAPNQAVWNVQTTLIGGAPTAGSQDVDTLQLDTPGTTATNVVFTPTSQNSGTVNLTNLTSNITLNGVEQVSYEGDASGTGAVNDTISIIGTNTDDTTVVNPTGTGTGTFRSGASPDFNFRSFIGLSVTGGTGGFDSVEIDGSDAADTVNTTPSANTIQLDNGTVTLAGIDSLLLQTLGGNDSITLGANLAVTGMAKTIQGGDGNDNINLSALPIDAADPVINGGTGDDVIVGSPNADTIYSGGGNDIITGGPGTDEMFGDTGSTTFIWNQGDGSDTIDGGTGGANTFVFNGATAAQVAAETISLTAVTGTNTAGAASGNHILFQRTQGASERNA